MAGRYGLAAANDIVPNGGIVPLPDAALPATINLATYATCGQPSVLNIINTTGTWSVSSYASPASGVAHQANVEVYIPVNGKTMLYINGSGTVNLTLYTTYSSEN